MDELKRKLRELREELKDCDKDARQGILDQIAIYKALLSSTK